MLLSNCKVGDRYKLKKRNGYLPWDLSDHKIDYFVIKEVLPQYDTVVLFGVKEDDNSFYREWAVTGEAFRPCFEFHFSSYFKNDLEDVLGNK